MYEIFPNELPILRIRNDLAEYLGSDSPYAGIRSQVNERRFTVSGDVVPYRVMNHWADKNILPDSVKNVDGWRRFTLVEMAWIYVVISLRDFGLSLEQIAKAKKVILRKGEGGSPILFEYFFVKAAITPQEGIVIVTIDGRTAVASSRDWELTKATLEPNDMVLVSLKKVAKHMGFHPPRQDMSHYLSKGEEELIFEARSGRKEVKAKLKNGQINEIESLEVYPDARVAGAIQEILKEEGAFADVVTKYSYGKKQSAEVKRRKRVS